MRVVVAPDKFKGSLSASSVADAIAAGIRRTFPDASIVCRPVADGGEGTVEAMVSAIGGRVESVEVRGPLGDPVRAEIGRLEDGRTVVEVSSAVGLGLIARPDALRASSLGCGDLIASVLRADPGANLVVGVGGSASTDGGTGAASAVGWRFLDRRGRDLEPGGGALVRLATIDDTDKAGVLDGAHILGAVDVGNPLLGPEGSARVFAPQKGAGEDDVVVLEEGLAVLAERIRVDVGIDVSSVPGGGGAGGIGAGLVAFFGAELQPGFDLVAEAIGLDGLIRGADLVITGEGKLDQGSLGGKTVIPIARLAGAAGVPCIAIVGENALGENDLRATGIHHTAALRDRVGTSEAFSRAAELIADATAEALASPEIP
jgi:glycerate kinase